MGDATNGTQLGKAAPSATVDRDVSAKKEQRDGHA
jgi:hypothetical protein